MRPPAALSILIAAASASAGAQPATRPTTATAPAPPRTVTWHFDYRRAVNEARRRRVLLLVVYQDRDAPASETLAEVTLADRATRELLADFAAVRIDAATDPGKARLAVLGAGEAPLTRVLTAAGELLDSLPGFVGPAELRERLGKALAWQKAVTSRPFDAAARWRAVQARLALSTRHQAAKDIDALLKTPPGKGPKGVTRAGLRLARGRALSLADPARAEKDLREALRLAGEDARVRGSALLELSDLSFRTGRAEQARELCARYIKQLPGGPEIGRAWYTKAKIEMLALGKPDEAARTLRQFLRQRPDDPCGVQARDLLDRAERLRKRHYKATGVRKDATP
ncbi:MAG: tetratricopeptide repeat protein [Planctomycetota bacterium]|jgi:tetratricopeptide (TPR) repeat protein